MWERKTAFPEKRLFLAVAVGVVCAKVPVGNDVCSPLSLEARRETLTNENVQSASICQSQSFVKSFHGSSTGRRGGPYYSQARKKLQEELLNNINRTDLLPLSVDGNHIRSANARQLSSFLT